jgi:hypothetical protein
MKEYQHFCKSIYHSRLTRKVQKAQVSDTTGDAKSTSADNKKDENMFQKTTNTYRKSKIGNLVSFPTFAA